MRSGLLTLAVAQFLDLGTFIRMASVRGAGAEANPLVATLYLDHGVPLVIMAKFALLVLAASTVVVLRRRDVRSMPTGIASVVLWVGILAGTIGGLSNALTIG
ncbi:MAG TPA: hypothetical protein VGQ64_08470 [Candidatus Limnocylindrales bacterium]|jgi:hypothetical protein|nr:hypothetical protein [Candidatus Limnocylindrales bacterium]